MVSSEKSFLRIKTMELFKEREETRTTSQLILSSGFRIVSVLVKFREKQNLYRK